MNNNIHGFFIVQVQPSLCWSDQLYALDSCIEVAYYAKTFTLVLQESTYTCLKYMQIRGDNNARTYRE